MVLTQRGGLVASCATAVALAVALAARPAAADEIQLSMEAGRLTLVATGARLTDVLAAWSRVGGTRFVDAEALAGESVTLYLVDVAEAEALRIVLRAAAGYVAAPRRPGSTGVSRYDRVKILAADRGMLAAARAAGGRPAGGDPGGVEVPAGAAMPLEDMQRLLDAVSGTTGGVAAAGARAAPSTASVGGAPSGAAGAETIGVAPTTPFPGMVVEPGGR